MELIKNEYQLSKTLRFGLTLKEKKMMEKNIYNSHKELKDLVDYSVEKIKTQITNNGYEELPIEKIDGAIKQSGDFLVAWLNFYTRKDQIALDKDYYKILSRKIGFDGFWYHENKRTGTKQKMPQSREVLLSDLDKKISDKFRYEFILDYWRENILKASELYNVLQEKIFQYKEAVKLNRSDNKPNEVELRKNCLAFINLVLENLKPFVQGQLSFPKISKLDSKKESNKQFVNFVTNREEKESLLKNINELKEYFESNGGDVFWGRASLNPKTAVKNPNATNSGIEKEIIELGIEEIIKNYENVFIFENEIYGMSTKEKMNKLNDRNYKNLVIKSLLFKYKTIPATVQYEIASVLSKKLKKSEDEVYEFIQRIGHTQDPSKDYAELKEAFDINNYPLKIAFDFAWEGVARSIYHKDIEFPVEICKQFLKENFSVEKDNKNLQLYAQLLELNALLSTFKNSSSKDDIKYEIENLIKKINLKDNDRLDSSIRVIGNYLKSPQQNEKNLKDAKKNIGLFRGRIKNLINKYDVITKSYKDISMKVGRTYAEMRDKLLGFTERNKVAYYSMIVEDSNCDRYVLLQSFVENESENIYQISDNPTKQTIKAFYVNSVTSTSISKMIQKSINRDEYSKMSEMSDEDRENEIIKKWKALVVKKGWDIEFDLDFSDKSFEQIKKEIDTKCYFLEEVSFSRQELDNLVKKKDCLLLPIVNQDIIKENKSDRNQFTKDWNSIFTGNSTWRLTPEFRITYRKPTNNYPVSLIGDKRYSRFQMIAHFLFEYIPQSNDYVSTREQLENFNDTDKQKIAVKNFNNRIVGINKDFICDSFNNKFSMSSINSKKSLQQKSNKNIEKYYVFGIDRGQKELATLCIIDQDKKIVGPQKIYTRYFNSEKKRWEHKFLEDRYILDLSNLRVETTLCIDDIDTVEKVLVDLSEVKVKDKDGNYTKPNKMQVTMQQLAYIRKLQFKMQTEADVVVDWYNKNPTEDLIKQNFVDKLNGEKGLVSFYGSAVEELEDTLPIRKIQEMLERFKALKEKEKQGKDVKKELDLLVQLEPVDNLKSGVVANMVGVISYLLKKFNYEVYISLEDLTKPFSSKAIDGITGVPIKVNSNEGKRIDVERYAGLGLYNFFEMQLLKKLSKIQLDSENVLHLVPSFRASKNYDFIAAAANDKVKNQFGIVFFVDANATSKMCPCCGACNDKSFKSDKQKYPNANPYRIKDGNKEKMIWVERDKSDGNDIIKCYHCGFDTTNDYSENPLKYIKSGDDNAAYLISTSAIKAYELATSIIKGE